MAKKRRFTQPEQIEETPICDQCRKNPPDSIFFMPCFKTGTLYRRYCSSCFHNAWINDPENVEIDVLGHLQYLKAELDRTEARLNETLNEKRAAEEELKDFLNHCICESGRRFIDDSATGKQINYLKVLAEKHKLDLDKELCDRFEGIGIENLKKDQATKLIDEWANLKK